MDEQKELIQFLNSLDDAAKYRGDLLSRLEAAIFRLSLPNPEPGNGGVKGEIISKIGTSFVERASTAYGIIVSDNDRFERILNRLEKLI
jgi:hypothetical protein